jgi:membrane protease YdiL (CAAX protease family)
VSVPYHLLARDGRYRWWRPLVESVFFAVLVVVCTLGFGAVMSGAAALSGVGATEDGFVDPAWDLAFAFGSVAVALPAVLLAVRCAGSRRPGTVSGVAGRLRWGLLLYCLRWALVAVGAALSVDLVLSGDWDAVAWPGWGSWARFAVLAVLIVPFQAAAEEYLCRGWLFQTISSWTRSPWPAAVLTSAVFVALHEYDDPFAVADLAVFALAMCWLTVRTGGLEAAIALHVVTNAVGLLVTATQGVPDLTQSGHYGLAQILPSLVATLAYTAWVARSTRGSRRNPRIPFRTAGRAAELEQQGR